MREIAALFACLFCTGQGHRVHLLQEQSQTNLQERRERLEKASDTVVRHASSAESVQYQSNSWVGTPCALKGLARFPLAFDSRAGRHATGNGQRPNMKDPSGMHLALLCSREVGSPRGDTPKRIRPRRAIARSADPRMAVTTPQPEIGDDDFEAAFSHLATAEELPELRKRVCELESLLLKAIHEEDFAAAARLRDEARELRSKDPEALIASLHTKMLEASSAQRYNEASKYRGQMQTLQRLFLPEYRLAGSWTVGKFLGRAVGPNKMTVVSGGLNWDGSTFNIAYDGDQLVATGKDGDFIFRVNVSKRLDSVSSEGPEVLLRGERLERVFRGDTVAPGVGPVLGRMYVMDDNMIAFWSSLDKAPAAAGGGRTGDSSYGEQDGRGHTGLFAIYEKVADYKEDDGQYIAGLSKSLKLDGSADPSQ